MTFPRFGSRAALAAAVIALAAGASGCASLMNMEMTRNERQAAWIKAGVCKNGDPALMMDLLALSNVTEAPTWRTLLCAGIDVAAGLGAYALGEDQGWWGGPGNDSNADRHDAAAKGDRISVSTRDGSPVTIVIGQGATGAAGNEGD